MDGLSDGGHPHPMAARKGEIFMKSILLLLSLSLFHLNMFGQTLPADFETLDVGRKIADFADRFDLSTPLNSGVTFNYLLSKGQNSGLKSASSLRIKVYFAEDGAPDSMVSPKTRDYFLQTLVQEVIVYKKAIACMISQYPDSLFSIRYLSFEDNHWLNTGEDGADSLSEARVKFYEKSGIFLEYQKRIEVLSQPATPPRSLLTFLEKEGMDPGEFVLDALEGYPLVIYGEIHKRMWSWNLGKSLIRDKRFPESTGTVFLEISAHSQKVIDAFLANPKLEEESILEVFREIQSNGWHDRGMFEFIIEVWKLNQTLPGEKKIKIIAADIPRPFGAFKTAAEQNSYFENGPDRNEFMVQTVENHLRNKSDGRHGLFIVGAGHAYKSSPLAPSQGTAGALLAARLPKGGVFSIFTHTPISDNGGKIHGRIRQGSFDLAFRLNGDKPVAFRLKDSPFGREPFDALPEMSYFSAAGTFSDNYDGYVFLGSLDDEPNDYILYDLYSDEFVKELQRRAAMENSSVQEWFGVKEARKEAIIEKLKEQYGGSKRWLGKLPMLKMVL